MVRGDGFTLVEVLVAIVVLEVGLLGVLGSLTLSARTLTRAERLERAVGELERAYDSLSLVGAGAGTASRPALGGEVRWHVDPDGWGRVAFLEAGQEVAAVVGRIPPGSVAP